MIPVIAWLGDSMIKVPDKIRTYRVLEDDFPIKINVQAKNLDFCIAVAGDVQVKKNGSVMDPIPVAVASDPVNLAIDWSIAIPVHPPGLTLLEQIDCMFPDNPPSNSKYRVTIKSAKGDVVKTSGSPPTINPRSIILTFLYC
jgi:hypothetical protein